MGPKRNLGLTEKGKGGKGSARRDYRQAFRGRRFRYVLYGV